MIPKIFHHIWMGKNEMHAGCKDCLKIMRQLHPDFEFILWDDNKVETFMKTEFPEYYDKFYELPRLMMKIDYLRFFAIYKYGGIYTDLDYYMLKKYDLLDYDAVFPCSRESDDGKIVLLGNCIYSAMPEHPFLKTLVESLLTIDRSKVNFDLDNSLDKDPLGTGPAFLTNMWNQFNNKGIIYNPPRKIFHPPTNLNSNYIENLREQKIAYGMHLCTGLWRNNRL